MSVANPRADLSARIAWWPMTVFAIAIAAYALSYLIRRDLAFPPDLRDSFLARPWGIYGHALFGATALAFGPFQFRRRLMLRHRKLHRVMGRVYAIAAFATGVVGLYMAVHSFGGPTTHVGFGVLGVLTAFTTIKAYTSIRSFAVSAHREWMIRSFALIFAAVTLRIELPLLIAYYGDFAPAYRVVSWLSWVPNLLWAEWFVHRARHRWHAMPRHSRDVGPRTVPETLEGISGSNVT